MRFVERVTIDKLMETEAGLPFRLKLEDLKQTPSDIED
jgi:hypothetical protein